MINQIIKKNSLDSYTNDIARIDYSKMDKSICEYHDICYMNDMLDVHKLDVYYKCDGRTKPILIDIHGGGFISNDKELNHLFGNHMAKNGFVVFNINYRLAYPQYTVFDQIQDVANAVSWIVNNADNYNADVNELYIAGHSSAGVLALIECILTIDDKMKDDFGVCHRTYKYKGIILDCGLLHFYKKSIAYWGMRNMVFPKGYKRMKAYQHLIFDENEMICKIPKAVLLTNEKDELKEMTYHFNNLLEKRMYLIFFLIMGLMGIWVLFISHIQKKTVK